MTQPSFKNRPWNTPDCAQEAVSALLGTGAVSPLAARVLAARGCTTDALAEFLDPRLKTSLPNPSFFLGMEQAVARLSEALLAEERIAIWSDYDVDGACSAAILARFLRAHGAADVRIRIPDRIHEGYGPNAAGLAALQDEGYTLVCVLDSGTTAFAPLEAAAASGLDVLVVDHHMPSTTLPPAVALINPNRPDQEPGFGHLCAAAMTFILALATDTRLRALGNPGADLMPLVGLVALATVCDVVSLTTLNRAFVAKGLPLLSARTFPGIASLAEVAGIEGAIDVGHCGFGLGPRINAGGRIGQSDLGARLLATDDADTARQIAIELDTLNRKRRDMERATTSAAIECIRPHFTPGTTRALALAVVDGHEGIVGISAARVKEAFDAPAFVLAPGEGGLLKGSGRSVPGFDLGAAVVAAAEAGILVKGGGHPMAAGLTIAPDKVDTFVAFVNAAIATSAYGANGIPLRTDAVAEARDITLDAVRDMAILGPFGMGNPTPRFLLSNVRVVEKRILRDKETGADKHVMLRIQDASGRGQWMDAPLWGAAGTPIADAFTLAGSAPLDLACGIEINCWNDKEKIRLVIEDARLAAPLPITTPDTADAVPF